MIKTALILFIIGMLVTIFMVALTQANHIDEE